MRKFAAPLFFAVVAVAILYAGWQVLLVKDAYRHIADAPQGQSVGPADAGVVIAEFMDYRCKPCRQLSPVMQEVVRNHPEIRLVFRHRSVTGMPGLKEAQIALAAGMQGKFMAMHNILMTRDDPVQDKELDDLCGKAGVDCTQLRADMADPGIIKSLEYTEKAARALDIKTDPAFLIGKNLYTTRRGKPTAADFDQLIAQAKAEKDAAVTQAQPAATPKG
jgi:protein-disulfide isomerase